jgi:hypothetical protein
MPSRLGFSNPGMSKKAPRWTISASASGRGRPFRPSDEERRPHPYQNPGTLETVLHLTMAYAGHWVEDTTPN